MAYCSVNLIKHGAEAIAYCLGDGHGHNGYDRRNMVVVTINMLPGTNYIEQFEHVWRRGGPKIRNQLVSTVISFSKRELNPDDPLAVQQAKMICVEYAKTYFPGRQAMVFVQSDGRGHNLHAHILVSNVSLEKHPKLQ